jgi:signal transduction histidine kinase
LDVPPNLPDQAVDASRRHNLFYAVKEALHNVVKHSEADEAWVRVRYNDGLLRVAIEDDGRSYDPVACEAGDGLANMRERMKAIGGHVEFAGGPGQGSRVSFELRLADTPPGAPP